MRKKYEGLRQVINPGTPADAAPAFITNGRWYRANGMWLTPEEIRRHKGKLIQYYLKDEAVPERIRDAEMISVNSWIEADSRSRATLAAYDIDTLRTGEPREGLSIPPDSWILNKIIYETGEEGNS